MKTNAGNDFQATAMANMTADSGTSTAVTSTSLTCTGKTWTTNQWVGSAVMTGTVYGIVTSNTSTVLTIDRWYTPATPGGAAASTPATGGFVIAPGDAPAAYMALTENSTAPAASDTALTGELTAGGLNRSLATYAHTSGAASYTLTKTWTSSDGTNRTINKYGVFNALTGGIMVFESAVNVPPTLISGDQITLTATVNL